MEHPCELASTSVSNLPGRGLNLIRPPPWVHPKGQLKASWMEHPTVPSMGNPTTSLMAPLTTHRMVQTMASTMDEWTEHQMVRLKADSMVYPRASTMGSLMGYSCELALVERIL